jgi:REP element-mobilizing transposase RayT
MPQSRASVLVHIVFSTKNRFPFLANHGIRKELHAYLGGACKGMDCPVVTVGGVADHVHILCFLSRKKAIAEVVKEIKMQSSKWIKSKSPLLHKFEWQRGYGIFSVNTKDIAHVKRYIENQEERHRIRTFKEEFRHFLDEHEIAYDERYVWD